jgi:hypothetical protein
MVICLKFAYFCKVKVELRKYVINTQNVLTPENAKTDELLHSKEDFVSQLMKTLPKYKDSGCPFEDKRKTSFKGMTPLDNGDRYQGTWVVNNDGQEVIHGKGVYVYANGSQYVGWFYEGEIIGTGRFIFHNGDVYQGELNDQQYNGKGKYIFGDTHSVVGNFEGVFKDSKVTDDGKFDVKSKRPLQHIFGEVKIQ